MGGPLLAVEVNSNKEVPASAEGSELAANREEAECTRPNVLKRGREVSNGAGMSALDMLQEGPFNALQIEKDAAGNIWKRRWRPDAEETGGMETL